MSYLKYSLYSLVPKQEVTAGGMQPYGEIHFFLQRLDGRAETSAFFLCISALHLVRTVSSALADGASRIFP